MGVGSEAGALRGWGEMRRFVVLYFGVVAPLHVHGNALRENNIIVIYGSFGGGVRTPPHFRAKSVTPRRKTSVAESRRE